MNGKIYLVGFGPGAEQHMIYRAKAAIIDADVVIGNSSTILQEGLMITPRGYANKYQNMSGDALDGEQAGRSLSMGLLNWKSCLRRYLQANNGLILENTAEGFDVAVGEVLSAISQGVDAGEYRAIQVPLAKASDALNATKHWGSLRGIVWAEGGAVTELMLQGEDFRQRGDWLNIENEHFHLHVNWSKVAAVFLPAEAAGLMA